MNEGDWPPGPAHRALRNSDLTPTKVKTYHTTHMEMYTVTHTWLPFYLFAPTGYVAHLHIAYIAYEPYVMLRPPAPQLFVVIQDPHHFASRHSTSLTSPHHTSLHSIWPP